MSGQISPKEILFKASLIDQVLSSIMEGGVIVSASVDQCVVRCTDGWEVVIATGHDGDLRYTRTR
ncbi:MAG: hypothetical protein U1D96_11715 [Eubacteriales bacterium]|jgi:hypothetical protein|nr:hypothetical protein [Bacillota bacterium]MBV1727633.1 hypothetical protein [Desulforudis sp.]MDQ7789223.1 hypothetical protein [Clostridia bacterium]MDZ4044128.1 hypothetical protein [Eubacteriales bacterium]MBU4532695.1 hypothetical protein [Bacillota bacterium]